MANYEVSEVVTRILRGSATGPGSGKGGKLVTEPGLLPARPATIWR